MHKTFSDAFIAHLKDSNERVTVIAKNAGVTKEALYSLKYSKTLNMGVDEAIRVAAYFGKTVEEFMGLAQPRLNDALIRRIESLSPRERDLLQAAIDAFLAKPDQPGRITARDAATDAIPASPSNDRDP